MAVNTFESLEKKYSLFQHPVVVALVNDKNISGKNGFTVSDIVIDLTSGFEASTAELSLYGVYDIDKGQFQFDKVKKYILLGSRLDLYLGYGDQARQVFTGAITRVNFLYEKSGAPCIRLTAMDVKGVMMSGCYSKQLKADNFADAVTEILNRTAYEKLKSTQIIKGVYVTETPDKLRKAMSGGVMTVSSQSVEMVAESDYEFVVKAAKKNNYEFFTECGNVYFRKAKADQSVLISIGPDTGLRSFDISYDVTGLTEKVTVRSMDVAKGQVISAQKKFSAKISQGSAAMAMLKGSEKVYIDPSVTSKEEAEERAASLMEQISYRYGSLRCEMIGIPELLPGHFVEVSGLGTGVDNTFYLSRVRHIMTEDGDYTVQLEGQAASADGSSALGTAGALGGATGGLAGGLF